MSNWPNFPLVDNAESLIATTDMVFIDPPGTGLSEAIQPNTNKTFWSSDPDVRVMRDFIRCPAASRAGLSLESPLFTSTDMSQISFLRRASLAVALVLGAGSAFASTLQAVSPATPLPGAGCRVPGAGCRVPGAGCRVPGAGVDGPFIQRGAHGSATSPTTGAALVQEARSRLATSLGENRAFGNDARITQAQAQANGLGYVAQHFQEIDTAKSGKVSLKQEQEYLQQQR